MDVPTCAIHKAVACHVCADAALRRMTERTTPIFINGRKAGNLADLKAGKTLKVVK